ncbi:MAG: sugar-binding protein [Pirellulales bacterium]
MRTHLVVSLSCLLVALVGSESACFGRAPGGALEEGVRGVATRAPQGMKIDGDLSEFRGSFSTPVCYYEPDVKNRAAQFFYMWDDEAFYAGLRTLDEKQANPAPDDRLWEGDGVEWYFDTRRNEHFRSHDWGKGAVHMYWTGYKGTEIKPRWCLRPDMLQAIEGQGVEVAARKTSEGAEVEFKLPWSNFPDFKVAEGAVIALDAELCYSDGGPRVYRTFAYGSPLSVQQPASLAKIQLVNQLEPAHWRQCGPVMAPIRCDTPWLQETNALVTGLVALPPDQADQVRKVVFRLLDTSGQKIADYEGRLETLDAEGNFLRARAQWPTDVAVPGAHFLLGILFDKQGRELTRVAPRMVSVHNIQGY